MRASVVTFIISCVRLKDVDGTFYIGETLQKVTPHPDKRVQREILNKKCDSYYNRVVFSYKV